MTNRYMRRKPQDVRIETQSPLTSRSMRSPKYDFMGQGLPMGVLIPTSYAPVLAGDTVKSSKTMARILSEPIAGNGVRATLGAWFETWLFYVRIGDMANQEAIRSVLIDPTAAAEIDWRNECLEAIWRGYFTDDNIGDSTGYTPAYVSSSYECNLSNYLSIPGNGWWDSITKNADLPSVAAAGGDDWQEQWIRYQALRRARLTTSTWEEYLAKSGVNVPPQLRQGENDPAFRVPELLKWQREFAYPQPAGFANEDGEEAFRVQWFIQSALERGRFAAEPGFLVQCIAIRPKIYRDWGGIEEFDPLELLNDAAGWLPTDFDTDPHASLVNVPASVLGDTLEGAEATLDIRDLYLYGSQMTVDGTGDSFSPAEGVVPFEKADRFKSAAPVGEFVCEMQTTHRIASRVGIDTTAG